MLSYTAHKPSPTNCTPFPVPKHINTYLPVLRKVPTVFRTKTGHREVLFFGGFHPYPTEKGKMVAHFVKSATGTQKRGPLRQTRATLHCYLVGTLA